jgi:CBS domain-containing protein
MSTHLITVREGASIEDVLKLLINHQVTGLPVVDAQSKLVGVISEFDLLAQLSESGTPRPETLRKPARYSPAPATVLSTAPLEELLALFVRSKFRRLPVIDAQGVLTVIISRRDLDNVYSR